MRKVNGPRNKGFTLIELLVVISIIALLLSILMPALNKARASGRAVVCMSNLRQFGVATQTYVAANKDVLPLVTERFWSSGLLVPKGNDGGRGWSWAGLLHNTGGFGIASFHCPADQRGRNKLDISSLWNPKDIAEYDTMYTAGKQISYSAVMVNYAYATIPWSQPYSAYGQLTTVRMSKVPSPATKQTIWDGPYDLFTNGSSYQWCLSSIISQMNQRSPNWELTRHLFRHTSNGKFNAARGPNALFLDGHVQKTVDLLPLKNSNFSF